MNPKRHNIPQKIIHEKRICSHARLDERPVMPSSASLPQGHTRWAVPGPSSTLPGGPVMTTPRLVLYLAQ